MTPEEAREAASELWPKIKTHEDYVEWDRLKKLAGPMPRPSKELPADADEKLLEIYRDRPMD